MKYYSLDIETDSDFYINKDEFNDKINSVMENKIKK